jgi:succinate dehydrogenase/fumarate reductase iron-sulfur protein
MFKTKYNIDSILKNLNKFKNNQLLNIIKNSYISNILYTIENGELNNVINSIKNDFIFPINPNSFITYKVYRYDPFVSNTPWIQSYYFLMKEQSPMLLDNLFNIKDNKDETLSFRRSCREGICGSCAMNINGTNSLACTYVISEHLSMFNLLIKVYPLPHMSVVKDLIVCMKHFYLQYKSINPFLQKKSIRMKFKDLKNERTLLINKKYVSFNLFTNFKNNFLLYTYPSKKEYIQYDRNLLDGLYECILCACCSTSCPSYWWNKDKYLGPAILLQSYRWLIDSRDELFFKRLSQVNDIYKIGRCHSILNCVSCCPKGLNPAEAINNTKSLIHLI